MSQPRHLIGQSSHPQCAHSCPALLCYCKSWGSLQPDSVVGAGGHVISAIVGCTVRLILKDVIWLSSAIGMAFALVIMQLTCTLHPPGTVPPGFLEPACCASLLHQATFSVIASCKQSMHALSINSHSMQHAHSHAYLHGFVTRRV